ncbi:hypothetical protein OUZ56_017146 [Daphnia magna]|uniref:Reverse transcriptase domain-containing protein n=1 Tax=Daphnia magna TaxID=35525 RepID=A0ABR0AS78_9CRUS|nr:hypothetical protein OUZ56_017146 [Daphnia magna]
MFYQSCMQEMAQADTFDWVAFEELRNFSNSWDVIQYVGDRGCHDSSQPSVPGMGNAIVEVDFETAYDLVNRDVLWRILERQPTGSGIMHLVICRIGRIERPQRSVVYRPVDQGGLEMINTTFFYRSLFLCPIYKVLTGPDSPESSLLRFWLSFPLPNMLQLYDRNKPAAVIERPSYLLEPLRQIKDLLSAGILAQGKPMIHKETYRHWIQEVSGPGKIEILRPDLD